MERNATCKQTKYFDANEDPIFEGDILEFSKIAVIAVK